MSAPIYLRARGRAIWDAYDADKLQAGSRALIHELGRLADALDKLDMILGGHEREWAKIVQDDLGEITLEVDALLSERRQHAVAFKTLYAEIRTAGLREAEGIAQPADVPQDMLAKRKREKEARERQLG